MKRLWGVYNVRWASRKQPFHTITASAQALWAKTIILIDEYDVPLDKAYRFGYYDIMVELIRALFGAVLKTNLICERLSVSVIPAQEK